jgi:hypothetical protein
MLRHASMLPTTMGAYLSSPSSLGGAESEPAIIGLRSVSRLVTEVMTLLKPVNPGPEAITLLNFCVNVVNNVQASIEKVG